MATTNAQSADGFVDNWQAGKTLAESNLHMFETQDSCDVTFLCGAKGHVIKAHRFVLISRSCVFHAMFSGPLAEKSDVSVLEIEPEFFRQLLIYMYTDDVTVDAHNATALLYAARKYAVCGLENKCKMFLENNLTYENACVILQASHHLDQQELFKDALSLIKGEGEKCLQSSGFLALSHDLVDQIIESDYLNADEHVVFTVINNWAEAECDRQGRGITHEAKRSVLGEILMKVRFPLMTQKFLVNKVRVSGLLTDAERLNVLDYIISPVSNIHPFNSNSRCSTKGIWLTSRRRFAYKWDSQLSYGWCIGSKVDAICFKSNKDLVLRGYKLYGQYQNRGKVEYSVTSYLGSDATVLDTAVQKNGVYTSEGEQFAVIFPHPVSVTAGKWYTLAVKMVGPNTWHGIDGLSHVTCSDGVEFEFINSSQDSNGTCVEHGQIPSLIYRVMQSAKM